MTALAATASKRGARADMDKAAIDIAKALVRLSALTIFELRGEWRRLHRMPPPMRLSRDLLIRGIIYQLQERAYGGLSKAAARKLEQAAAGPPSRGAAKPTPSVSLRPGTRLVREWHGAADPTAHAAAFAVVGMAAFFTAVVRAPLTGIILVTEMTDNSRLLLPMLAACFSAMAVATMLREPPIYDALKERTLALWRTKPG
jgi:hypothetical protein